MSFVEEQALRAQEIEGKIKEFLPEESGYQSKVIEAMNYSMQAGGKRIRPMLMVETFKLCGGKGDVVWPLAVALEMVHNYSLVHDDLPMMNTGEDVRPLMSCSVRVWRRLRVTVCSTTRWR